MKIGILTYFWAHNAGTFLQAYSMLKAFQRRFPTSRVELVDYKHRKVYFRPSRGNITIRQLDRDLKRYIIYQKAKKTYLTSSGDALITQDSESAWEFIEKQKYDLLVVGSDTLLQFLPFHFRNDSVPVYWLPPELPCRKVMYAASCGGLTYEQLSQKQKDACKKSVNSFDLVGVRDDATLSLMQKLGIKDESKLKMIPDPTFDLTIDYAHADRVIRKRKMDLSKPTVALFFHRTLKPAADVAEYFRSKGYQIFTFSPTKYTDICFSDISPFAWAGMYRHFSLVITGAFHGILFSLKNLTPVVSVIYDKDFITSDDSSKYRSLLKEFGLERENLINGIGLADPHIITETADRALARFDEKSVKRKIAECKDRFNGFLESIATIV